MVNKGFLWGEDNTTICEDCGKTINTLTEKYVTIQDEGYPDFCWDCHISLPMDEGECVHINNPQNPNEHKYICGPKDSGEVGVIIGYGLYLRYNGVPVSQVQVILKKGDYPL
jgi:hypothetical protein